MLILLVAALLTAPDSRGGDAAPAWRFAVSGDSRNCGDVVMPAIAAGVRASGSKFYWHLGDFRKNEDPDDDFLADPAHRARQETGQDTYLKTSWADFIDNQLGPFGSLRVILSIGNHELKSHTREQYLATFRPWLPEPSTYNHWNEGGVAFIALDNATHEQFDAAQMEWFRKTLAADEADPAVRSIVVGMHAALPDSISFGHSMSEGDHPVAVDSGREVYKALLRARDVGKRNVYVLASHSHFYMDGTYNTPYWLSHGGVLPGWIIGTAGAMRYPLPLGSERANQAMTHVYGFETADVSGDGSIRFEFHRIEKADVPSGVVSWYGQKLVDYCFDQNMGQIPGAPAPTPRK
jgi:hypothetical protein